MNATAQNQNTDPSRNPSLRTITGATPRPRNPKADFPFFAQNPQTTWLDSGATSQKPSVVIQAVNGFMTRFNSNTGRGNSYVEARRATEMFEEARATVAHFIGASDPKSLVWTTGTTEAVNMVAGAFVTPEFSRRSFGTVLISDDNHHAGVVPFHIMHDNNNDVGIGVVSFCRECHKIHTDEVEMAFRNYRRPILLVVPHISNVLGVVNDIKEIVAIAHRYGVPVLVDGAQAVGHMKVNVEELDVDFYAFSGHKMLGPTGIGGLYVAPRMFSRMRPWKGGGEMITRVTMRGFEHKAMPHMLEPGTQNVAGAVGLAAAVRYLEGLGMDWVENHIKELGQYTRDRLNDLPGITLYGQDTNRGGSGTLQAFSFMPLEGIHHEVFVTALGNAGIAIRAGRFCADPTMDRLGLEDGAMRFSFHVYNTNADVDKAIMVLRQVLPGELRKADDRRRREAEEARQRKADSGCNC